MTKSECEKKEIGHCEKGEVFPKDYPYFILDKTIKQHGLLKLGKIKIDTGEERFIVEDQYTATRYKDFDCALNHFEENIKIDKEIRKEFRKRP